MNSKAEKALLQDLGATEFLNEIDKEIEEEIQNSYQGLSEASYSREEVQQAAETSLDFLAALALPEDYKYQFPPIYLAMWSWLVSFVDKAREFPKLALGIPRGFSKTTLAKLFALFCILFTKKKFIFVICATAPKAQAFIADVISMLDELNIRRTFGDWRVGLIKDTQEVKIFSFRERTIILAADGAQGKGIRGLNLKNKRPDIILFDDIQTREDADSVTESDKIYRWMLGTAMKAKAFDGCMYIFIANMYPLETSILKKLKKNPQWLKFISGGILEDGTSLWEDLQPLKQLLAEYEHDVAAGHEEIFLAEVMNDEDVNVVNSIDIRKISSTEQDLEIPPIGKYIVIDPATGKPGSNNVAIGMYYLYERKPILVKIKSDRYSPLQAIKESLKICAAEGIRAIFVESTAYQATFLFWFDQVCAWLGVDGIEFLPIDSKVRKNIRIRDGYKKLISGEIEVSAEVAPIIKSKFRMWNPLKVDNDDDELDLIGYADYPMHKYPDYLAYDIIADADYRQGRLAAKYDYSNYEISSPF